jgi:hypothetical protein
LRSSAEKPSYWTCERRAPSEQLFLNSTTTEEESGAERLCRGAAPKGRSEGSAIENYVVEDHVDHVVVTFKTQQEAIDWSRKNGQTPLIARVRHLNDKKKPYHWWAA